MIVLSLYLSVYVCVCLVYALSICRLQRIFLPKMTFLVRQKVQISSKNLPQIPNFASLQCTILTNLLNFVKCHQKSIFSSRRPVFIISSVFRQKRNPLEPIYLQVCFLSCYGLYIHLRFFTIVNDLTCV